MSTWSEEMDTCEQATVPKDDKEELVVWRRQRWSIAQKRRIVEETLTPGASVARVARANNVNSNQVFGWRRLYLAGRLGKQKPGIKLLPVRVSDSESAMTLEHPASRVCDPEQGGTCQESCV